jgi:probable HAF family extracellular repeat protein
MTGAAAINDLGQIVGVYVDADGAQQAFLLDEGVVTTIDIPGAVTIFPVGLNNRGQVVGAYDDGGRLLGFVWENGALSTLAVPPGTFASAFPLDIDDRGRIFGSYF